MHLTSNHYEKKDDDGSRDTSKELPGAEKEQEEKAGTITVKEEILDMASVCESFHNQTNDKILNKLEQREEDEGKVPLLGFQVECCND